MNNVIPAYRAARRAVLSNLRAVRVAARMSIHGERAYRGQIRDLQAAAARLRAYTKAYREPKA